ncbi:unnamed protein product [Ostreobium quekettii]|uniref:LTD domain-containing protein n=1 Tax=Ostreobium quekettii TaxID=121088 RepID=A0A8S1IQ53_9CHLO|nr:unnamed protein product [Ostreobium quekettii]
MQSPCALFSASSTSCSLPVPSRHRGLLHSPRLRPKFGFKFGSSWTSLRDQATASPVPWASNLQPAPRLSGGEQAGPRRGRWWSAVVRFAGRWPPTAMQWRGAWIWWSAALALWTQAAMVSPQGLDLGGNGDECGSGQVFPVEHDGAFLVGCSAFGGENWCRRQDGSFVLCPELPIEQEIQDVPEPSRKPPRRKKAAGQPIPDDSDISPNVRLESTPGLTVTITEIMAVNDRYLPDDEGQFPDWIEIHNAESFDISLKDWSITDDPDEPRKWLFPDLTFVGGGYYVLFASGKDRSTNANALHTNFRLKSDGEYIALVRPDGTIATAISNEYPRQLPNISYGIPDLTAFPEADKLQNVFTFLSRPTPAEPNSEPLQRGPYISSVLHEHGEEMPPEGEDLTITAFVAEHLHPVQQIFLTYRVNYGEEAAVEMLNSGNHVFTTVIPAATFTASDMVRWFVTGVDTEGNESRDPPLLPEEYPVYYGTVIADPSVKSDLPILHWYSFDPALATSQEGGQGSLYYEGRFYDNVLSRRRGVTALTWPKPKIKFDFKGKVFKLTDHRSVEEFNLQSFWEEPGEDTYLREPVAFQVMREAGVPAPQSFHVHVRQNGVYYGLFAFVEQIDDSFLEKNGRSVAGMLFKATSEQSNLRWDVKQDDLRFYYRKGNRVQVDDWWALYGLNQALGGGGTISRSLFVLEYLDLPEIINYMAVNNLLLNQDRCTKNFYIYRDAITERWSILPWDTESAMGISSGLGGVPAPDYCVLVCEQWNSPLYCDSDHPQDIPLQSGFVPGGFGVAGSGVAGSGVAESGAAGRRLSQTLQQRMQPREYPVPTAAEYDADLTFTPAETGPRGNYHHLDDAILDLPVTRTMYVRRLRTLMDQFLNGRLKEIIDDYYNLIRKEAVKDNKQWGVTDDVTALDKGYQQLIEEQLPTRYTQLYETYGPFGVVPLIPEAQPEAPQMQIVGVDLAQENLLEQYIQIYNPNAFAVDMSSWKLLGSALYVFPPGTVALPESNLLLSPSIPAFRNRPVSPRGGEGHFVLGTYTAIQRSAAITLTLTTDTGAQVSTFAT